MSDHVSYRTSAFSDQDDTAAARAASSGSAISAATRVITQPRLLGLALYRAWALAYFSSLVLFPYTGEGLRMLYWSHSLQLELGVAALVAVFAVRARPLFEHRRSAGFIAVLAASGTLLPALAATISEDHATQITLLGIMFAGLAKTWFGIMWGSYYAHTTHDVRDTTIHAGVATALGILLVFFAIGLPRPIGVVIIAAFPLLSLLALPRWTGESWIGPVSPDLRQTRSISPFLLGVAVCACVSYLLRILTSTGGDLAVWDSSNRVALLATGLTSLAFASALAYAKKPSSAMLYRLMILLILAGYVILPFLGPNLRVLSDVVFRIGYTCFEMMTWALLVNWARAASGSTIQILALGSLASRGGLWAGIALGVWSTAVVNQSAQLLTMSLLAVFALVIGFALVFSEKTLASLGLHTAAHVEQPNKKARWVSHCAEISACHGLTSREEEIMTLLSRGRGTPAIGAGLGISVGTVRTHIKHIYWKLDVHSRQELIGLIEGCEDSSRT